MKGNPMYEMATKLILSQRYIHKLDGAKAMLVDICGNDAIVELEQGQVVKISTENFKTRFQLYLCA